MTPSTLPDHMRCQPRCLRLTGSLRATGLDTLDAVHSPPPIARSAASSPLSSRLSSPPASGSQTPHDSRMASPPFCRLADASPPPTRNPKEPGHSSSSVSRETARERFTKSPPLVDDASVTMKLSALARDSCSPHDASMMSSQALRQLGAALKTDLRKLHHR